MEKAVGNGWYAPETVVSSRLIEANHSETRPADFSIVDADIEVLDPDVLPPEPHNLETSVSTRIATQGELAEYAISQERASFQPRVSGTRVRVAVDPPLAQNRGWIMAAVCAAMVVLGMILVEPSPPPKPTHPISNQSALSPPRSPKISAPWANPLPTPRSPTRWPHPSALIRIAPAPPSPFAPQPHAKRSQPRAPQQSRPLRRSLILWRPLARHSPFVSHLSSPLKLRRRARTCQRSRWRPHCR